MKRAITFKGPDRIPHNLTDVFPLFHIEPESWQPREPYYPYIHPMAITTGVWKSKRPLPNNWLELTREAIDEWGVIWNVSKITSLGIVKKGALEDGWHLLDGFTPPDFSDWSRYEFMHRMSNALGGDKFRFAVDVNSLWERFHFLRGFNNALMDLIEYPEESRRLLKILTDATLIRIGMFHRAGAEAFMLLDDLGTQLNSFISPAHFAEFFEPCYKIIAERCHELGMFIGIHSCGNIRAVIPGLLRAGMNFLQLDSPLMCGIEWLAENVGGKAALLASPDIQTIYPKGTDAELEAHIKKIIAMLGCFNGGLVAWPYVEPHVIGVDQNRVKLQEELFMKYGKYPLNMEALSSQ